MRDAVLAVFAALSCIVPTACANAKGNGNAKASSSVNQGIKEGDQAPTFSVDSVNGRGKVTITPGKVTLVDFWATWCVPCKKNFAKYQEIYEKYKSRGLEIAAVSVDDEKGNVSAFAAASGVTFPVGWDEGRKIESQFQLSGVPTLYIIGKDGTVKYKHLGGSAGSEMRIDQEIQSLL